MIKMSFGNDLISEAQIKYQYQCFKLDQKYKSFANMYLNIQLLQNNGTLYNSVKRNTFREIKSEIKKKNCNNKFPWSIYLLMDSQYACKPLLGSLFNTRCSINLSKVD